MEIETERILLRSFAMDDAADLQEILGDAETMQFVEPPYTMEKTLRFLRTFCIAEKGALAAVYKPSGKVIGYLLFHPAGEPEVCELGWIFNRRYWGNGYAFEASAALADYAFSALKVRKLFAETIDPAKSAGLMKKLGMQLEGVQRNQVKNSRGEWTDLYLYGLFPKAFNNPVGEPPERRRQNGRSDQYGN